MDTTIPAGAITETPRGVMRRLKRGKTWLYGRIKSDPSFPRPFYLGPKEPRFFQHEVDAWLESKAVESRTEPARRDAAVAAHQQDADHATS
jgi:predicted DNA-binding transcriptional regulator AlpA